MIEASITPLSGQHCETTATGTLIRSLGFDLSEPMLFGLGQGLGYIYWNMKNMDVPFLGGRIKPDMITQNLATNLGLELTICETSSIKKAWRNIEGPLKNGTPVGLKLDCYDLDYFGSDIHFAAHYVAMYGYDEEYAYLVDTARSGLSRTTRKSLERARNARGPMSSRNLSYTITAPNGIPPLEKILPQAIKNNAQDFLNPPIQNIGYKGIAKTAREIKKWYASAKKAKEGIQLIAMLMERAGTGGGLFRIIYTAFLKQAHVLIPCEQLERAIENYSEIAAQWVQVAALFETAAQADIDEACELLPKISLQEKETMETLASLST